MLVKKSGIYFIVNLKNGKLYIGQTNNLKSRAYSHFHTLRKSSHSNRHLQFAFNKYGESNFLFYIAEFCDIENITAREQYWIDYFCKTRIYNLAPAAGSNLGIKFSDEAKANMSAATKGRKQADHVRAAVSAANRVRVISNDTRLKLSDALRKRVIKDSTRLKLSVANKGRPLSDDQKKKLSIARSERGSITAFGKTLYRSQWSEITGLPVSTIAARIKYGWSVEDVLSRPARVYLEKMHADGANIGVQFHANPNENRMML